MTDNLSSLKLDLYVFPRDYDIRNPEPEQCLADGYIYMDDMLTHDHETKKEYLLLQVKLMGNGVDTPWFVVDLINNGLKNGPGFNDVSEVKLQDQPWINSVIIKGNKPSNQIEPKASKID